MVSRKKAEPSDAEKKFMTELQEASEKSVAFGTRMDKLKSKMKYQQIQVNDSQIIFLYFEVNLCYLKMLIQ